MSKNKNQGITLISLVITIILLLILATVAINLAVDSDGLFSKAGDAANKWNSSVAEEDAALQNLMTMLDEMDKGPTLGDVYSEDMIGQSVTYEANGQSEWIILGEDPQKEGHILITTKEPVADGFTLNKTATAWLSYENDMHTACEAFGGKIGGVEVEARSITMEDINSVTGFEEPEFDTYIFGTEDDEANKKIANGYPKAGSTWTCGETTYTDWKFPTEENETTFEADSYQYNDSIGSWFGGDIDVSEMVDPVKGDLIWGTDNNFDYLVATRMVSPASDFTSFLVAGVRSGSCGAYYRACGSGAGPSELGGSFPVAAYRPVVAVPTSVPVEEVDGVYDFVEIK